MIDHRLIAKSLLKSCKGIEIGYTRETFRWETANHSFNEHAGVYIRFRQGRPNAEIFPNAKTKTEWSI
jgi:hypothetical protein